MNKELRMSKEGALWANKRLRRGRYRIFGAPSFDFQSSHIHSSSFFLHSFFFFTFDIRHSLFDIRYSFFFFLKWTPLSLCLGALVAKFRR
jgi:hypothetical protein